MSDTAANISGMYILTSAVAAEALVNNAVAVDRSLPQTLRPPVIQSTVRLSQPLRCNSKLSSTMRSTTKPTTAPNRWHRCWSRAAVAAAGHRPLLQRAAPSWAADAGWHAAVDRQMAKNRDDCCLRLDDWTMSSLLRRLLLRL